MLQANSVASIAETLPRGLRARGAGVQGAAQAIGLALGPAIGGLLLGIAGWRLIFLVNVPVGAIGIVLGWPLLPRSCPMSHASASTGMGRCCWRSPRVRECLRSRSHARTYGHRSPRSRREDSRSSPVWRSCGASAASRLPCSIRACCAARGWRADWRARRWLTWRCSGLCPRSRTTSPPTTSRARSRGSSFRRASCCAWDLRVAQRTPRAGTPPLRAVGGRAGVAAVGLLALAFDHDAGARTAALLMIGAGVGDVRAAQQRERDGGCTAQAGGGDERGILNTTRGCCRWRLGVSLAGLLYQLAAGTAGTPHSLPRAAGWR